MAGAGELGTIASTLASAGCVAPEAEAAELMDAAERMHVPLHELVARRVTGEPLAWITGVVAFCGLTLSVAPGVYVPRWQTEQLALAAVAKLPSSGVAVDLCTGAGAIAAVMKAQRPHATVVATDIDPDAVACARSNGVDAYEGDLDSVVPERLAGTVDVLTACAPYVPSNALPFLPRDVIRYEPHQALDGGAGGTSVIERIIERAPHWLRPGGQVLLEFGGDQRDTVTSLLQARRFDEVVLLTDEDGDDRGVVARYAGP